MDDPVRANAADPPWPAIVAVSPAGAGVVPWAGALVVDDVDAIAPSRIVIDETPASVVVTSPPTVVVVCPGASVLPSEIGAEGLVVAGARVVVAPRASEVVVVPAAGAVVVVPGASVVVVVPGATAVVVGPRASVVVVVPGATAVVVGPRASVVVVVPGATVVVVVPGASVVVVVAGKAVVVVVPGTAVEVVETGPPVVLVDEDVVVEHTGRLIVLASKVTAPVSAKRRPTICAPVLAVIEVFAMMVPTISELVPSVAELPTAQKTVHASAPLRRITRLPDAVVSVLPIWKTYSPPPLR